MTKKLSRPIINLMLVRMLISFCYIKSNKAATCSDCPNIILGTESMNLTYGPTNIINCNCDWRIPDNLSTDDDTAMVLLLQNASATVAASSGTSCSGEIRFPSTSGYRCDFPPNYCLAFVTGSSKCNINKIRKKIPVENHTCDSTLPWNKAGGSPYKIRYHAGNYASHTKYFTIQYLVINCFNQSNTSFPGTTPNSEEVTSTTPKSITSFHDSTMKNQEYSTNFDAFTTASVSHGETNNQQISISTTIIIIAGSVGIGLIIVLVVAVLMKIHHARNNKDTPKNKVNADGTELNPSSEKEIVNNPIYDTSNSQKGLEIIVNGIYELPPDAYNDIDKTMDVGEPCLYAVVQKQEENKKEVVGDSEEDIVVTIEDEPASVYAVVNKDKK